MAELPQNQQDRNPPESGNGGVEWVFVHDYTSEQEARIVAGHLLSHQIPAVVVPKRSSVYSFALPGMYEVWVPLNHSPDAVQIIYSTFGPE